MIERRLRDELDRAASRVRRLRVWQFLAIVWLALTALGLGLLAWQYGTHRLLGGAVTALAVLAVVGTACAVGAAIQSVRDRLSVARRIEQTYPDLSACLLAAIEQKPDVTTGAFGFLQSSVIRQALDHARRHPWSRIVPAGRMRWAVVRAVSSFGLLVAVLVALMTADFPVVASIEEVSPDAAVELAEFAFTVEPGDTEVEKGTSLLVLARITGKIPTDAALFWKSSAEESQLAMSRSLNDPIFGGRVPSVVEPLEYRVEINGQRSEDFHVTVFEYPRLERADAKLVYPKYAGLAERTIEDVRVLSVPEGTELTLVCRLNKAVASATLNEEPAEPISLAAVPGDVPVWEAKILCDRTRQLKLELVDDAGRKNQKPVSFKINVLPNQPVALKPVFPGRDLEASPLEELDVKATAWDDYGVKRYGVSYTLAGESPIDVVLGEDGAAKKKHELAQQIRLEELKAEPDELLAYHWWAEDLDREGQPRRVESDMYFAEVRRFDEIFREGEQPAGGQQQQRQQQGGQGQNAQDAQELAKLQKDIINATWKVIRREIGSTLTDRFVADMEEIALSQQQALEQAQSLAERIEDPESALYAENVLDAMKGAIQQLEAAVKGPSRESLQPALKEEQKAYQALLKLRAREHRVVRQQRQQGGGGASARSQQQQRQMEELDLQNQDNPYETQRLAQSEQQDTPEARENRQVLNRLRELARRQDDLNERLKELQASLEEAKSEEEKEEIRRQLQRLQEEQQQILQDTDELQARMDQPENQERMAEERQQLEEARDQARRASEALEQQQVSQAAATGTRAQREFEELRNEFRRRTSGQFSEEMREMRDAARDMDRRQQELSKELKGESKAEDPTQPKSLADDTQNREQTVQELADQRQRLAELQERMRRTIEESETTEPLLAERLYDAARGAQEQNLDRALQAAESSLRRGLVGDATQQEEAAGRGITQLREGVERAAESVLGDESEALRRAREEVERLNRELNQEIARNSPEAAAGQDAERTQDGSSQPGSERPDERTQDAHPGENPRGQSQPRQSEDGQQPGQQSQPGERPGQQRPGEQSPRGENPSQRGDQQSQSQQEGQQPGERSDQQQAGEQSQSGQNPSQRGSQQSPSPQEGQQPGQQGGQSQSNQEQSGQQPSGQQQDGQQQGGQQQGGQQQGGQQQGGQRNNPSAERDGNRNGPQRLDDSSTNNAGGSGVPNGDQIEYAPLTGGDFLRWSDRLRDVEEMVEDPELRAEAARIRERARAVRAEFKRHSKPPEWEVVQTDLAVPLMRLRDRISEELLRRTSREAIVPLDRDPVPPAYSEKTRRYYERLGTGR